MNVTIVDYNSGNISSVINSFKEVAKDKVNIKVTADLKNIKSSDKVVLPGQGSFKSCIDALNNINGLVDTLNEFAIDNKKPLLGICVGLQMFADVGYEETETKGLGWISGKVSKINNQNGKYKLPHIGWNQIDIVKDSKIYKNIEKQVILNVIDEGRGFREKDTSKIFKRFYSNRPDKFGQHSGLGLNIVKNLVELHKGSINASNRLQKKGANIEIIFPKT